MEFNQNLEEKLLRLLKGERIPASSLDYPLIKDLDRAQVIQKNGKKDKVMYSVDNPELFESYLRQNYAIEYLKDHLSASQKRKYRSNGPHLAKALAGFFVTSYEAVEARYQGERFVINPPAGISLFFNDYNNFIPAADAIVVGIANAENFKHIHKQKHLFTGKGLLFAFRHSQSKDLVNWLQLIPNQYLHFGNYDFASLSNYYSQYRSHLGSRCSFFIPANLNKYFEDHGSTNLYDNQVQSKTSVQALSDGSVQQVIKVIEKHKKGLEQKYFINQS